MYIYTAVREWVTRWLVEQCICICIFIHTHTQRCVVCVCINIYIHIHCGLMNESHVPMTHHYILCHIIMTYYVTSSLYTAGWWMSDTLVTHAWVCVCQESVCNERVPMTHHYILCHIIITYYVTSSLHTMSHHHYILCVCVTNVCHIETNWHAYDDVTYVYDVVTYVYDLRESVCNERVPRSRTHAQVCV